MFAPTAAPNIFEWIAPSYTQGRGSNSPPSPRSASEVSTDTTGIVLANDPIRKANIEDDLLNWTTFLTQFLACLSFLIRSRGNDVGNSCASMPTNWATL